MPIFDREAHERAVAQFFVQARLTDPERYEEVTEQYPVLSRHKLDAMRKSEVTVGLLGLQAAHISAGVAEEYGFASVYMDEDDA